MRLPELPAGLVWNPHALPCFLAALVLIGAGTLIYRWERGSRLSRHFLVFSLLFTSWTLARGLLRLTVDAEAAVLVCRYFFAAVALGIPPLVGFIMLVLHTRRRHRRLNRANWILGILLAVLSVGTPWVVAGVRAMPWGFEPQQGPLGFALMAWVAALMLVIARDAVRAWRGSPAASIRRRRLRLFAAALACLYLSSSDLLVGAGLDVYPSGLVGVVAFTLLSAYLTWKLGLSEVPAQFAVAEIADMVRGALLVLDGEGFIQSVNDQTVRVLGLRERPQPGTRLAAVLGDSAAPQNLAALAAQGDGEHEIVHAPPSGGPARHLSLSVSARRDPHGRAEAFVCVVRDVTDQKRQLEQRAVMAARDELTRLPNRAVFMSVLDSAVRQPSAGLRKSYSVIVIGLDRLRIVNEDLGYAAGDHALIEVARRLTGLVDRRPRHDAGDLVSRVGGDEFGLLIHHGLARADLDSILGEIEAALRAPMLLADHDVHIGASIGVATSGVADASGAELLQRASIAMFEVKARGGGGRHVDSADRSVAQRTRLESELRRAIEQREIAVHYQPVIDVDTQTVAGFEALARWPHPRRGLLAPGEFIDVAQSVGLIAALDAGVLERACADLRRLQDLVPGRRLFVSVNQSGEALARPGMADHVGHQLARHRLVAADLRIELLETAVLTPAVKATVTRLDALGVGLCTDDFGTGHSSLSRLHEVPISTVKIDRSFVRLIGPGTDDRMIRAIVTLAMSLGLDVIAEGVTHPSQARQLREAGCALMQGYLFSPPVPFEQAAALLRAGPQGDGWPAEAPA